MSGAAKSACPTGNAARNIAELLAVLDAAVAQLRGDHRAAVVGSFTACPLSLSPLSRWRSGFIRQTGSKCVARSR
jgi:hypothetical protein